MPQKTGIPGNCIDMRKEKLTELKKELRKALAGINLDGIALEDFENELEEKIDRSLATVMDYHDDTSTYEDVSEEEVFEYTDGAIGEWAESIGKLLGEEMSRILRATAREVQERIVEHEELHGDNDPELAYRN
jgi:hypothetical protein